jgi:DNA-directed RNA polymerase
MSMTENQSGLTKIEATAAQATETNNIEEHPLWGVQVELERGMLREGADRVRDRVAEAMGREQMTRLAPVRGLLEDWLPAVADGVKDWCRVMDSSRGPKPLALNYLRDCDPYVVSLIALRAILDSLTVERSAVTALAMEIGRTVEHEQQVRLWEREAPDLYYSVQHHLKRSQATAQHRERVNINRFNALLAEGKFGFGWEKWSQEVQFRVGVALIDNIVRVTQWFNLVPDPQHSWKKGAKRHPPLVLVAKPGLVEWLGKQIELQEVSSPLYKPTVIPPRRWEGTRSGGYWTPYVKTPRLIRFKANQEDQRDRAADEYDALDMPKVYDALHFLQEVPWRVNRKVLNVARVAWERDLGIAKLPLIQELPLPVRSPLCDTDEEEEKKWKRSAAQVHGKNAKRLSRVRAAGRTLRLANDYAQFERFYFPHMLDFRGRMYPIPVGLQPQGDDLARGLLEFAEGKPVTRENGGARWLAIHLASMWGNDKCSFDERLAWVQANSDLWERIASDPFGNLDWTEVDKPWAALAAVFDWVGYLEHGDGYVSHLPIHVDGTCNGIQHLSAMTRDHVAGEYVNLVPGEKPRDIYKFVADNLQKVLERIEVAGGEAGSHASFWLDLCNRDLPRSLTKRQVMVLPYGGTKDSFFTYTRKWLDENCPFHSDGSKEQYGERTKRLSFLVHHMWDVVNEVVSGGMGVMKWLQDTAKHAATSNQPIFWITPSGFVVRHFYGKTEEKKATVSLDGTRVNLSLRVPTKNLDVKSQLQGIAPNFVHSMDATALALCILSAKGDGITAFTSVHDAYGTHAADMQRLFHHLRQAFVETHSTDVLGSFRAACQAVMVAVMIAEGKDVMTATAESERKLLEPPPRGALNLSGVLESNYFFA